MQTSASRLFAALIALVAGAALALQYVLLLRLAAPQIGIGLATLRFFSYFTVLSNLLVLFVAGSAALDGRPRASAFFARPCVQAGVALYIGITGLIYLLILRHLWQPQGAQWWADTGLHYATPLLYLPWWLLGSRHGALHWRDVGHWLLFPLGFLLWSLLRGAWLHEYPYPFIDVDALGMAMVLRNSGGIMLLFVAIGAVLVVVDRTLVRRGASGTP